ncbi:hypothetical protein HY626_00555 [Candidatus Uhrbacteria bacterium]|nr:hypothetical protein [Candidatus Uhrbacteria bacterium]
MPRWDLVYPSKPLPHYNFNECCPQRSIEPPLGSRVIRAVGRRVLKEVAIASAISLLGIPPGLERVAIAIFDIADEVLL